MYRCRCEKEVSFDEQGDWDIKKNVEKLTGTKLINLTVEKDGDGFYLCAGSSEANAAISFYPPHCPFCGRKLRQDMMINYIEF